MKHILLLSLMLILSACSEDSKKPGKVISEEQYQTPGQAKEEVFVREKQRTIRYNCSGKITSDRIETINSVSKKFYVKPKNKKYLFDFRAKNITTGKEHGHLFLNRGAFTLDLAPTVFNIDAKEGLNEIQWKFFYCQSVKQDGSCTTTPEVKYSGVTFIHIRQETVVLEGSREFRPTAEECRP